MESDGESDDIDDFDDFDDFADDTPDPFPERYWYTPDMLATVDQLQTYLESQSELGKSVSLANLERVARTYNDGKPLSYLFLTAILGKVPDEARNSFIAPYSDPESGQIRISTRLHETGPTYDLNELIAGIENFAVDEMNLPAEKIHVTGVAVLFDNMLQKLVRSQISTLGFVVGATFLMFALLLRSFPLALVGLVPNILAALVIMAFMGYARIPLDLMTITIASIVIGIGVDDAIHYLHRYQEEIDAGAAPIDAVLATHRSIGSAMYFTTFTVIVGFAVLLFSRFMPTVYFGALAALAMLLALVANLTLLPSLLIKFQSPKQGSSQEMAAEKSQ